MRKRWVLIGALLSCMIAAPLGVRGEEPLVVASTAWTGALARAAGAENVVVLAPIDLRHPAEYDFTVKDVARANEARFVVWGGYEPFIKKMAESMKWPAGKLVTVQTDNYPSAVIPAVRTLGALLGTPGRAGESEARYAALFEAAARDAVRIGAGKTRVVAHSFQAGFMKELGYNVVGIIPAFGELTLSKLQEYARLRPDLVVDNWHNEVAGPVAQAAGCRRVSLINFPGPGGTSTIEDVLRHNCRLLGLSQP